MATVTDAPFLPGDIVTRDGTDEQVVLGPDPSDPFFGTIIDLRCIKAPESGWIAVGERESNLPGRYQLVRRPDHVPTGTPPPPQAPET